jgi:hypothetical protein
VDLFEAKEKIQLGKRFYFIKKVCMNSKTVKRLTRYGLVTAILQTW